SYKFKKRQISLLLVFKGLPFFLPPLYVLRGRVLILKK
ncbi:MAG: hypothetical protein ACI9U0_000615, partial [Flavobacteriales bacterium]